MTRALLALVVASLLPLAAWAEGRSARSFSHTVGTSAARVEPPTGDKSYVSIRCWQSGYSAVYVGGKDVSPKNGFAICSSTFGTERGRKSTEGSACASASIELDVSDLYAVVARPQGPEAPGMQVLSCIAVQ